MLLLNNIVREYQLSRIYNLSKEIPRSVPLYPFLPVGGHSSLPPYPSLCVGHCASPQPGTTRPLQTSLQTCRKRRRHFLLAPAIASALPSLFSHGPSAPPLCSLYCHPRPQLGAPGPSRARLYLELPEAAGDSPREQRDRLGLPCRGEAEAAQGLREEGASDRSRLCITEAGTWVPQQVRLERWGNWGRWGREGGLAWALGERSQVARPG